MSDVFRAVLLTALGLAGLIAYVSVRTARIPASAPDRLVAELRLAQVAALVLALVAGAYVGFAASDEGQPIAGLEVALAVGFFVAAAATLTREPHESLRILAIGFGFHAVLDALHGPGVLGRGLVPFWYASGCATFNVFLGACCYLPLLKR